MGVFTSNLTINYMLQTSYLTWTDSNHNLFSARRNEIRRLRFSILSVFKFCMFFKLAIHMIF